jgi:hypothetical protein
MANVIIGIHGLGNKPPEAVLKRWWMLAMNEGLRINHHNNIVPPFELVFWADILYEKLLDPAEKNVYSPYFVDEKYTGAPEDFPVEDFSTRKRVVDYLGKQMNHIFLNEDLTLNYSFISDAIIDRYFKDLEIYYSGNFIRGNTLINNVNELIRKRLCDKLEEHRNDNIMLISHSMGSIIAFDVLTFLVPDIPINTFITMGSPLGLPVVISKIAAERKQRGIAATVLKTPPGITENWYNFSDILDKVAFNYKLSEFFSENNNGVKPVDFLVINNYMDDSERNPHKSFGYLRTPEFSQVLNEFIKTEKLTAKEKILRKLSKFGQRIKSCISIKK